MGNRAVITDKNKKLGIYLHWNGGFDSVSAFLKYAELKNIRTPESDSYGWARLCQIICNFMGGDLSVGIDTFECLDTDNGDNGTYIIENWQIVGREYAPGREQKEYELVEMVKEINSRQPEDDRLSESDIDLILMNKKSGDILTPVQ